MESCWKAAAATESKAISSARIQRAQQPIRVTTAKVCEFTNQRTTLSAVRRLGLAITSRDMVTEFTLTRIRPETWCKATTSALTYPARLGLATIRQASPPKGRTTRLVGLRVPLATWFLGMVS